MMKDKGITMKYLIGTVVSLAAGIILGFFGVFNSVFSDGGFAERMMTIAVILIIYVILGASLGFFLPKYSWLWGLLLCIPGILMLILYLRSEFNPAYPVYMILLLALSCLGSYGGGKIKSRRNPKAP